MCFACEWVCVRVCFACECVCVLCLCVWERESKCVNAWCVRDCDDVFQAVTHFFPELGEALL